MKIRLDELIIQRKLASSLKEAQALIGAGQVYVNETCADKSGSLHDTADVIRLKQKGKYVSRGGLKLEKALHYFEKDVQGLRCIDIGASSGGFTDCLLQHGAACVFAVDVAYGQFSWKLRQDARVFVLERFNARNLTTTEIFSPIDLAVIDASFISLKKLIPPLLPLFDSQVNILALIKPQFELPKDKVGKGGVVVEENLHQEAIELVSQFALEQKLKINGVVQSPILGPKGNKEFIIFLSSN